MLFRSPAAVPAAADWGLSFPTEGESPMGNVSAEDLAQYNAYYLGDTSQKVLYLTFDCGYENGYTEAILDALKKHSAPAARPQARERPKVGARRNFRAKVRAHSIRLWKKV